MWNPMIWLDIGTCQPTWAVLVAQLSPFGPCMVIDGTSGMYHDGTLLLSVVYKKKYREGESTSQKNMQSIQPSEHPTEPIFVFQRCDT